MVPDAMYVEGADSFSQRDFSKVKDLAVIDKKMDWSFSSPYKGTIQEINPNNFDVTTNFQMHVHSVFNPRIERNEV
jgi:hypothetical protein